MKLLFLLACALSVSFAAIITSLAGMCTSCISQGYNYCLDDSTCIDNRPTSCVNILDRIVDCPASVVTCRNITINNLDVGSME